MKTAEDAKHAEEFLGVFRVLCGFGFSKQKPRRIPRLDESE
jgi:hypothetical protein